MRQSQGPVMMMKMAEGRKSLLRKMGRLDCRDESGCHSWADPVTSGSVTLRIRAKASLLE